MNQEEKNKLAIAVLEKIVDDGCVIRENELVCKEGTAITRALYNKKDEDFAIALTKFDKDSVSTRHFHKSPIVEHIVLVKGLCVVSFYDNTGLEVISTTTVKAGESITIPSDLAHEFLFLEYSEIIAIVIPRDETFPT